LTNLQSIRFGWASVETLAKEFEQPVVREKKSAPLKINRTEKFSFNHKISLRDICFSYNHQPSSMVIKNANLEIYKGQSIGLIGESGSGKSTFANLVLGFMSPTSGQLLVDNQKIDSDHLPEWRTLLGYVPQDVYLMDDTLLRNIAFGLNDEDIDKTRAVEVLKIARLDQFVENSLDGLQMMLGERGVRISGGQKQRVGIARALYHDPEILVFDESTTSLDPKTESEILETLKPLKGKKTFIIIAHRKTALKDCDFIYKIEEGKISQENKI